MNKKHGARSGEITFTEAKKLIPDMKPYQATKIFEAMEHAGTARIGTRRKPPCGRCNYVNEEAWKIAADINRPIEPNRTVKKPAVKSKLHDKDDIEDETRLLEPGIPTEGHKYDEHVDNEYLKDHAESQDWNDVFHRKAEEPETEKQEQQPAPASLEPEDQYSHDELFDIISDFEVVKQKPGTANAGCKAATRLMKRSGISNVYVDWTILSFSAGILLFTAFMRKGGDSGTDENGKDNPDKADTTSAKKQESSNIRLSGENKSRTDGDDLSTTKTKHGSGSWFNTN